MCAGVTHIGLGAAPNQSDAIPAWELRRLGPNGLLQFENIHFCPCASTEELPSSALSTEIHKLILNLGPGRGRLEREMIIMHVTPCGCHTLHSHFKLLHAAESHCNMDRWVTVHLQTCRWNHCLICFIRYKIKSYFIRQHHLLPKLQLGRGLSLAFVLKRWVSLASNKIVLWLPLPVFPEDVPQVVSTWQRERVTSHAALWIWDDLFWFLHTHQTVWRILIMLVHQDLHSNRNTKPG